MKIITVFGTRPEFIKLGPLVKEIKKYKDIENIVVDTGQHYDHNLSNIFINAFRIESPKYNLKIGSGSQCYQTAEIIKKCEDLFLKEKPNLVIVFGDTTSTIGAALTAVKLNIPIAHIEAGLRSYDKSMPEEINRVIVDQISTFLFCPTKVAIKNLKKEGITKNVFVVGDIMIDSLMQGIKVAEKKINILEDLNLKSKEYYLATVHRQSNTDEEQNLNNIVDVFCQLKNVVLPLHPRTEKMLKQFRLYDKLNDSIKIIPPQGYFEMLLLEKNAKAILTDSGGIQKEAYFFKTPCITLRDTTEWVETVENGWNVLVHTNKSKILDAAYNFKPNISKHKNIYGSGRAVNKMIKIILENFL